MKKIYIPVIVSLCFLYSCVKEQPANQQTSNKTKLTNIDLQLIRTSSPGGFGYSTKPITGLPYTFPAGVTMADSVSTSISDCTTDLFYECSTDGDLPFYMTLINNNTVPTSVIFPAGLVIPSLDTILQNAILVQPDTITLPAKSKICVNLYAYCINDHRTFNENHLYGAPMISSNGDIYKLIGILATKQTIEIDTGMIIQKAVWDIADNGVMSPSDIAAINQLP